MMLQKESIDIFAPIIDLIPELNQFGRTISVSTHDLFIFSNRNKGSFILVVVVVLGSSESWVDNDSEVLLFSCDENSTT